MQLSNEMLSYTGISALTIVFLSSMLVQFGSSRMIERRAKLAFSGCVFLLAILIAVDWFITVTEGSNPSLALVHKLSTCIVFSLAPVLPVVIAYAIFPSRRALYMAVPLAANIALEVASFLREGLVFWVTPENHYQRGPFYLVYVGVYAFTALYLVLESVRASRMYQNRNHMAIATIVVTMFFGVILQLAFPAIKTTWTAVAMAVFMYYHLICEFRAQIDELTTLLDRRTYERFCESPKVPATVVIFDVDDFKHVNDTYGHAAGDEILRAVADVIRKVYSAHALCYRTGGDEFCAIFTSHHANAPALADRFAEEIATRRAQDPRLPSVSVGFAKAERAEDFAQALSVADASMYQAKQSRKAVR